MRYSEGHKDQTRKHILETAGKKFRKDGVAAVGLAGLMADAGLTNGAFYAHFKSKEDLLKNVIACVFEEREADLAALYSTAGLAEGLRAYLSPEHRDNSGRGCPTAALVAEIGRHPKSTRKIFTEKLEATLRQLAQLISPSDEAEGLRKAIAVFSLIVGAIQLARAVTDKELSDAILASALDAALVLARDSASAK